VQGFRIPGNGGTPAPHIPAPTTRHRDRRGIGRARSRGVAGRSDNCNAAGTGARIALLDQRTRKTIEQLVRQIENVETAVAPRFQEFFVAAMAIPHLTAPFPHLRAAMTLPEVKAGTPDTGRRSRRAAERSR
jgi:hypothetical protein